MSTLQSDYIKAAQKRIGPISLASAVYLEAKHRLTGQPRPFLALCALSEATFASLVIKQAEAYAAADQARAGYEKFAAAKAAADAESKAQTDAIDREHEIQRARRERRNKRNRTQH